jgi:hypothetical protein
LWLHTLSPTFLPLLEAFLESVFWKASQLLRHIPHDVLAAVKTGTLQWPLQFGEQPEITRSHVWRLGSLTELECRVWPGNSGSGVMNEPGHCHDASANCMRLTGPVSCANLHHKDDGWLPKSILCW